MQKSLLEGFTEEELKIYRSFRTPMDVQLYLNDIPYNPHDVYKPPRLVIRERTAHCFEGALFAAVALRFMGHRPLLINIKAHNDDDHILAMFKEDGLWGCVAKSNTTTLRFREPVYMSVRELVMSYFDLYFNTLKAKTMREYSAPFSLEKYDTEGWMTTEKDLGYIGIDLWNSRHYPVISKDMIKRLSLVDDDVYKAGFLTSNEEGLYKAKPDSKEE